MEMVKAFPSLILDIISKVVPGILVLAAFQNRYLPPNEMVLKLFGGETLSGELLSWFHGLMVIATAYFIGVFIAIAGNLVEMGLMKYWWFKRIKKKPDDFLFREYQSKSFKSALESVGSFLLFIDHCRNFVYVNAPASAVMLEKYRTAYRLFFGLSVLFFFLAISPPNEQPRGYLVAIFILFAGLSFYISKQYMCKSFQMFSFAMSGEGEE